MKNILLLSLILPLSSFAAQPPLPEPFAGNFRRERRVMMELEPDNLTWMFRVTAGLDTLANDKTVARLGGWESPRIELRGHTVGHWLSGMANVIRETDDPEAKRRSAEVVHMLALCQQKIGTGYLSAFPESFIDRAIAGQKVWAPWYALHKVFAGLLDQYEKAGNEEALEVALRFADWTCAKLEPLTPEQLAKMRENEYGGMGESLWNLSRIVREDRIVRALADVNKEDTNSSNTLAGARAIRYARAAEFFYDPTVMDDLTAHRDALDGKHLNTTVPKVLAVVRKWQVTGDLAARDRAEFFFKTLVDHHMYAPGCFSDREFCKKPDTQGQHLTGYTGESCVTYNMLKLAKALYEAEPREWIADYIERAVLNHILAQPDGDEGRVTYFMPVMTGSYKLRNPAYEAFWCCVGSAMESQTNYRDYLFALRHQDPKQFTFRLEPVAGAPDRVALFYGPWLLGGCLGTDGMAKDATRVSEYYRHDYTVPPHLRSARLGDLAKITPIDLREDRKPPFAFKTETGIVLKPLSWINGERWVIYWER